MELTESIESINRQLVDEFGIDTSTGRPIFRVVWSEDQLEKRLVDCTPEGLYLLYPEVREVKKYGGWIREKYILERLVIVPEVNEKELPTTKLSYEPLWVFHDKEDKPVPPAYWACKFIVDTVYAAMGKRSLAKYVDEEAKNPIESREKRIKDYEEQLFGDESGLLGTTITGESIIVPHPQKES